MFRKSANGQEKTKMNLPESPFFKSSLAGASGQLLISMPDRSNEIMDNDCRILVAKYTIIT